MYKTDSPSPGTLGRNNDSTTSVVAAGPIRAFGRAGLFPARWLHKGTIAKHNTRFEKRDHG
jgi:hypothetical protein